MHDNVTFVCIPLYSGDHIVVQDCDVIILFFQSTSLIPLVVIACMPWEFRLGNRSSDVNSKLGSCDRTCWIIACACGATACIHKWTHNCHPHTRICCSYHRLLLFPQAVSAKHKKLSSPKYLTVELWCGPTEYSRLLPGMVCWCSQKYWSWHKIEAQAADCKDCVQGRNQGKP